mmetsp:Transcript_16402/g.35465  ORF Transcript_16402/g.35465 Transcript_16402/m.35465 type:complete len:134 (+) Transcript_16402:163-564(+)|eukprot:CAMPEP_0202913012 /NCGR_PEP_ID=MMETSP1392-20130828/59304_1 /ASSEMBLY_ACC=CAM_ASM_000868 /TAXON_ID=225041 /ORGANISM="Chlamydomonas chlamydogama, Strain SAG 11-48b" /LENGTH=133 /DNA_ID=CAMNT_0049604125 /DNA_START=105 /DNA_END=506 /DNA_ORIENTATION=+
MSKAVKEPGAPAAKQPPAARSLKNRKIVYVSNLPFQVSEHFVIEAFSEGAGLEPSAVEMLKKGLAHGYMKSCGLAAVTMRSEEDAKLAVEKLDGKIVLGRPMIVRADKFVEDDAAYKMLDETADQQNLAAARR